MTPRNSRSLLVCVIQTSFVLLVVMQCCSLLSTRFWLTDIVAEFVVQFVVLFSFFAVSFARLRLRWWVLGALMGLIGNLIILSPLYHPLQPLCGGCNYDTLRIVQFNAFYKNADTKDFVAWANSQPELDVVVVVEAKTNGVALDALKYTYPYTAGPQQHYRQGIAIFSRQPLTSVNWTQLLPTDALNPYALNVTTTTRASAQSLRIIAVHAPYSLTHQDWKNRNVYLMKVTQLVNIGPPDNTIVIGDFNSSAWHPIVRTLQKNANLTNAQNGRGLAFTWHPIGWSNPLAGLMIDHLFLSTTIVAIDRYVMENRFGSDHAPVVTEIAIPVTSPLP